MPIAKEYGEFGLGEPTPLLNGAEAKEEKEETVMMPGYKRRSSII